MPLVQTHIFNLHIFRKAQKYLTQESLNYNLGQKFVERYINSYIFYIYCRILYEIVSPPAPPIQC